MHARANRPLRRLPGHRLLAAACLALVLAVPAARAEGDLAARTPAGAAGPAGFALTYDVYQSGLRALRLDFDVRVGDGGYRTDARLETAGIVGFLFDWRMNARSEGAWRANALEPSRHRTANVWRGRERSVRIAWRDGVPVEVEAEPPYGADDRAAVDDAMLPGTMDPMSAVTAMVLSNAAGEVCRSRTRIYDGRRRYDALLSPLGERAFEESAFADFAGDAEGCRLTFERIAGFKEDSDRLQGMHADIWLADLGIATGKVPVRLRLETPWGTGFAHLVRARAGDGRVVFGEAGEE